MTPTYLNPPPSPFPTDHQLNEDQHHQLIFTPNLQASSSSSLSSHAFFNSTDLDHSGNYHGHIHKLQYQQEGNGGSYDIQENGTSDNGLKLTLWKKKDKYECQSHDGNNSIKWMSSKMRLMKKIMKNSDRTIMEVPKITTQTLEDHQKQPSSPLDNDHHSSNNYSNIPIRVCSDCNTTKTPLWRSGPRGPKSLCNACGIRQRKARRAMAAAAAVANGTILETESTTSSSMKIKVQTKDKKCNNGHHVVPYKKRSRLITTPPHQDVQKKLCFEDLVMNLSKNLDLQRVFPQDEKEAAILLMALSCGLVHG